MLRQHLAQWNKSQADIDDNKSSDEEIHKELAHCKERLKELNTHVIRLLKISKLQILLLLCGNINMRMY